VSLKQSSNHYLEMTVLCEEDDFVFLVLGKYGLDFGYQGHQFGCWKNPNLILLKSLAPVLRTSSLKLEIDLVYIPGFRNCSIEQFSARLDRYGHLVIFEICVAERLLAFGT